MRSVNPSATRITQFMYAGSSGGPSPVTYLSGAVPSGKVWLLTSLFVGLSGRSTVGGGLCQASAYLDVRKASGLFEGALASMPIQAFGGVGLVDVRQENVSLSEAHALPLFEGERIRLFFFYSGGWADVAAEVSPCLYEMSLEEYRSSYAV